MARAPNVKVDEAKVLFDKGLKLIEIANHLKIPEGTVRSWKNRYGWSENNNATLQKGKRNVAKKKGGQPGNKNAVDNDGGAPEQNKNSEKHGFFSRYLPEETFSIIQEIQQKDPLDILWENIQIAYAAIVRAQKLMYVKDQGDITTTKIGEGFGNIDSTKWEVQQAWDKHATFLKAQARAQGELRSLIKQYDELLHRNWELATEEQKMRIELIKAQTNKISGTDNKDELQKLDEVLGEIKGVI